jgi:ribosomal peptide maturation radical SAM protein 1
VQCAFCGVNGASLAFRSKSPGRVVEEITQLDELWGQYGKRSLSATDSIVNMDFFDTVFPELMKKERDWKLFYEVKPNLSKEQLMILKQVGVHHLQVGIESLDTQTIQVMRKGSTAIDSIQFLKRCRELDIAVYWNFLYGAPGEKIAAYTRMAELIPLITHLRPPDASVRIELQRYSAYYCEPEMYDIRDIKQREYYAFSYPPGRINLTSAAYWFCYAGGKFEGVCEDYAQPVLEAIGGWQKIYRESSAVMYYYVNQTEGTVALFDSRPAARVSGVALDGLKAEIYALCDSIQSVDEVYRGVQAKGSFQASKEEIRTILDKFVGAKLMYAENNRYLSLAIRGQ